MPFANSNTITDDVTLTLPHIAFEILCPCTKYHSHTRLYNAAASSPSRPREGDSLAIMLHLLSCHSLVYFNGLFVMISIFVILSFISLLQRSTFYFNTI